MHSVIRISNRDQVMIQKDNGRGLEYLQFPKLAQIEEISHLFTTRTGGVSEGYLRSMNLSFSRGDQPENVLENYRRIGEVLGCQVSQMVGTDQQHTTNIRVVTKEDAGKRIIREADYSAVDGLITDVPGLALVCYYADCVPLYFADPVKHVIGLAHSGWRGTVSCMGMRMVEIMTEQFDCDPRNITAAIGPSICRDCYEISEEVAREFRQGFWVSEDVRRIQRILKETESWRGSELLCDGREPGKYQLDLWLANLIVLLCAGIRPEKIDVTDVCTCCNPEYLFSHRASKGLRGNLAAFLMLKNVE